MNLDFLRPVYEQIGEYVSVYLDTDRAHEEAAQAIELRWHAAREELAAAGASPASLAAAAAAVDGGGEAARGRAIFARDGAVAFAADLDSSPRRPIARLAPLPHLMPLLAQHRAPVPYLLVSATHEGGEIVAVGGTGAQWQDSIEGHGWPVHKTKVGGWSQDRYQRSVEEAWDENAKALAAEVTAVAGRIGAGHVIVAGDVRARSLLLSHLAAPLVESAAVIEEEIAADSPAMAKAADRALSQWAERLSRERFNDWQARLAHGLAVEGLAQVMAAFRDGQVSDLFVADDPTSTAAAWIGPAGHDLAVSRDELLERNVPDPMTDRADAALVRAVVLTDAELYFLPADLVETGDPAACGDIARPRDGVAATLRFSLTG